MSKEEIEFEKEKIKNLKEATSNYWTALLTANSILVGLFAVTNNYSNGKILILALVMFSICCSFLIIKNFLTAKEIYTLIMPIKFDGESSKEQIEKDINYAEKKHKKIDSREKITARLLIIEAILIIIIVSMNLFGFNINIKRSSELNLCPKHKIFYHEFYLKDLR